MIMYCYISHNEAVKNDYDSISFIMSNLKYDHYAIFYCGRDLNLQNDKIIHLECNDCYEGLPNKVHKICKYLVEKHYTEKYTHFCKIDSTTKLKSLFPIVDKDYYGCVFEDTEVSDYKRTYHQVRCSPNSQWRNKKYEGEFVPYCSGGRCYVLSNKSIECISLKPNNDEEDIYEDLYIGKKLSECKIYPYSFWTDAYLEL